MKAVYIILVIALLGFVVVDILTGTIDAYTFIVAAVCIASAVMIAVIEGREQPS